jgi:hypothetical protein
MIMSEQDISRFSEVPRATKLGLFDEVARLNVPLVNASDRNHPIISLLADMKQEHPAIHKWGSDVGSNINRGFGGEENAPTLEKYAFENSFIAAYGLIRVGYRQAGVEMPGVQQPPEWYMWIRDEAHQTIDEMFASFNQRQRRVATEYPDLLEATQAWASERVPYYGSGYTIGAVATAAAEIYHAFSRAEETAQLENLLRNE